MPPLPAALLTVLATLPAPPDEVAVDRVVATVEGTPILASEVDRRLEELDGRPPREEVVRQLVLARVFEAAAKAAEIVVPDDRVDEAMAARVEALGGPEAYREHLAALGTDFESDRIRVRDALLVDEYVRHALGRVRGSPHLRPHLARRVHVTPREVQEHFREHRDRYRVEARTDIGRLVVPKAAFDAPDEARARADELRAAASHDPAALQAAADADPRLRYAELTLGPEQLASLREELRQALDRTPAGAPCDVVEAGAALLVVVKRSEQEARALTFGEAQPAAFALLTEQKAREARIALTRELLAEAEIWPEDLFPQDVPSGDGVAPETSPP